MNPLFNSFPWPAPGYTQNRSPLELTPAHLAMQQQLEEAMQRQRILGMQRISQQVENHRTATEQAMQASPMQYQGPLRRSWTPEEFAPAYTMGLLGPVRTR